MKPRQSRKHRLENANAVSSEVLFAKTQDQLRDRQYMFKEQAFTFHFLAGPEMNAEQLEAAADLMEAGVKQFLEGSSMGWDRDEKKDETRDASSRVVLIYPDYSSELNGQHAEAATSTTDYELAALLCIRFEPEDLDDPTSPPTLYCYEIHVAKQWQRSGLGRFLIQEMVRVGKERKMDKIMLTAMSANTPALKFYETVGFEVDESSPDDADYQLLSLPLK